MRTDVLIETGENSIQLKFPSGWLEANTLPRTELEQESKRLKAAGFKLKYG